MARNKQWKAIQINWATLQGYSNDSADNAYYELTPRQAAFLQAWTEFGMWQSRWVNLGEPMDNIHNFVAQVNLNLMIENSIVTFDCNDVEACLASSAIIAAINAAIAQNASDISDNSDDIGTNQTNITNLQGRMTSAESAIAQHSLDIAQNTADIVLQAVLINDNATEIQANDAELLNHEIRITALEAGGGGGGDGTPKTLRTEELIYNYLFTTPVPNIGFAIPEEFTSLKVEILGNNTGADQQVHMFINNDLVETNYRAATSGGVTANSSRIGRMTGQTGGSVDAYSVLIIEMFDLQRDVRRLSQCRWTKRDGDAALFSVNLWGQYWESSDTITNLNFAVQSDDWAIGSNIKIWGIKEEEVLVVSTPITSPDTVTFDTGGYPYTDIVGDITPDGNPNNCISQEDMGAGATIAEFEFNITGKTISDIQLDVFRMGDNIATTLWIDDIDVGGFSTPLWLLDTWVTTLWSDNQSIFPLPTGDVMRFQVRAVSSGAGVRIDNFKLFF